MNTNRQENTVNTISLTALAAPQNVATTIAGFAPDAELAFGEATTVVRQNSEFAELRFADCATVTIHAPRRTFGNTLVDASVGWSSSSSQPTLEAAERTARVLTFAAEVARQLNAWVANGDIEVAG